MSDCIGGVASCLHKHGMLCCAARGHDSFRHYLLGTGAGEGLATGAGEGLGTGAGEGLGTGAGGGLGTAGAGEGDAVLTSGNTLAANCAAVLMLPAGLWF